MKRILNALLYTALAATLAACGRGEETPSISAESQALLGHVPADAPYVAANLAPLPEEVLDAWLVRLQPVLDEMQSQLSQARSDHGGDAESSHALLQALLRELDGKLNRAGLESLGFDLRGHRVVYGMGAFPVLRLGLSDAAALRAMVIRVLDDAGIPSHELEHRGASYWRLGGDAGETPVSLYVSIRDDHLAAAVLPGLAEAELLPAFLGLEKPAASDAAERLAALNRSRGYTPYGSAMVDLHRLADDFLQPGGLAHRLLQDQGELHGEVTPECVAEIHSILDNAPEMSVGTTELTVTDIRYRYHLRTPETLASTLLSLVPPIPAAGAASERLLELAFGMRFGPARDFVQERAAAVTAQPYTCAHLQQLNQAAADLHARLSQPMPPFVNNFRGIRLGIDDVSLADDYLSSTARGHLALHVAQPEMFVGMAQMFLPDLSGLALAVGEPPVRVPASLLPRPDIVAYAAMAPEAIGLSIGDGEEQRLPGFLDQEPGPEGSFLSVSYDTAAYLDYTSAMADHARDGDNDGHDSHGAEAAMAIGAAARKALRDMSDRSRTELRFVEDGLQVDGHLSFKPVP